MYLRVGTESCRRICSTHTVEFEKENSLHDTASAELTVVLAGGRNDDEDLHFRNQGR
jgi:hypothetical protein